MPASFRNARFHCDSNSRESGRRIVEHEFPKKDLPYAEDMGRHFYEFTVRAYCIVFPGPPDQATNPRPEQWQDAGQLFVQDYRIPRDILLTALEQEGPGILQLPTQPQQEVVCTRYRLTEEERFGGFCTFDITFQEYGLDPNDLTSEANTSQVLLNAAQALQSQILRNLRPPNPSQGTGLPTSSGATAPSNGTISV
jgi:prophage DNA circulation protein